MFATVHPLGVYFRTLASAIEIGSHSGVVSGLTPHKKLCRDSGIESFGGRTMLGLLCEFVARVMCCTFLRF